MASWGSIGPFSKASTQLPTSSATSSTFSLCSHSTSSASMSWLIKSLAAVNLIMMENSSVIKLTTQSYRYLRMRELWSTSRSMRKVVSTRSINRLCSNNWQLAFAAPLQEQSRCDRKLLKSKNRPRTARSYRSR